MIENIKKKIKEVEKQYNVRVLLAVESGSRAWGFASATSDFDVRFIYIHRREWYLSIDPQGTGSKKDVIEYPVNQKLDISGWELTKALRLFRKSNPTILEWLRSDFVYFQNDLFVAKLQELETEVFNPLPTLHHYFNLALGNYKKYFQGKVEVKIKICLYVVKSLLACSWIEKHQSFPPVRIQDLLSEFNSFELKQEIEQLIKLKLLGEDKVSSVDYQITYDFIETKIRSTEQLLMSVRKPDQYNITEQLDLLFRKTLTEAWEDKLF